MNLKIAAKSACSRRQLEDRISKAFTSVEIITFEEQFKEKLDKYEGLLNKYSNVLDYVSIHAPSGLTISHATNENHRRIALTCLEKLIVLASRIGCKRVVFHGFHPVKKLDSIQEIISLRGKALQNCIRGIESLDKLCSERGVTLCLENINACVRLDRLYYLVFSASPFDLLDVVEKVNSEAFRLCFDVAHAYHTCNFVYENPEMSEIFRFSELSIETFYKIVAKHVDIIHLTNAKGAVGAKSTEHLLPEEGEINFRQMMKTILENNFSGPIVLEMDELDMNNALNMAKSRDYLLKLLADLSSQ
ncbi:MAG: sugar phosphate isomerase/epimerase family protein [Candidatus Bathyarchaeia archaeon]